MVFYEKKSFIVNCFNFFTYFVFIKYFYVKISHLKVATIQYVLTLDSGEVVDSTTPENPFAFILGIGSLLPEFEKNMEGLQAGDEFAFTLTPENGYGVFDEGNIAAYPTQMFRDAQVPKEMMVVGQTMTFRSDDGHMIQGILMEIGPDEVIVDFNHPLAGETLHFKGSVSEVREPTAEELDHGHVHGPGGHHH